MAKCKSCGGNNAKKLSIIEKMGTETGTASTRGIGVSGGGIGLGSARTKINKKSVAASEASFSPTTEVPSTNLYKGCGIAFIGVIAWLMLSSVLNLSSNVSVIGAIILFIVIFFFQAMQDDPEMDEWHEEYTRQKEEWQKTWMCLDCGHKWVGK